MLKEIRERLERREEESLSAHATPSRVPSAERRRSF